MPNNVSYGIWEPDDLRPGGFVATDEKLETAGKLCGMDKPFTVPANSGSTVSDVCPSNTLAEDEECISGAKRHLVNVFVLIGVFIGMVHRII